MKKRVFALLFALALLFTLCACASSGESEEPAPAESGSPAPEKTPGQEDADSAPEKISMGLLKGPTGIGAVYLMDKAAKGETEYDYEFTLAAAPTDLTASVIKGDLDICALPTNVAATLYNKTEGEVQLLALNTMGVLYILENGYEVTDVASLAGRTIYATGQTANPEYVLNYILRKNGLEPGQDVTIEFRESEELTKLMASGEIDLCMLPVPAMTSVLMKNTDVHVALNLTTEWDKLGNGSSLTMGCIVVRKAFAEAHPTAVAKFLEEYAASVRGVLSDPEAASELVAQYEITGSAAVALAAIPDCNLACIRGESVQPTIQGYYEVLFDADPSSIGGALPKNDFYYVQK